MQNIRWKYRKWSISNIRYKIWDTMGVWVKIWMNNSLDPLRYRIGNYILTNHEEKTKINLIGRYRAKY